MLKRIIRSSLSCTVFAKKKSCRVALLHPCKTKSTKLLHTSPFPLLLLVVYLLLLLKSNCFLLSNQKVAAPCFSFSQLSVLLQVNSVVSTNQYFLLLFLLLCVAVQLQPSCPSAAATPAGPVLLLGMLPLLYYYVCKKYCCWVMLAKLSKPLVTCC
jgi:hypothetical protein